MVPPAKTRPEIHRSWHALPLSSVLEKLGSDPHDGLSASEASARFKGSGANELPRRGASGPWIVLRRQFQSVMVLILAVATLVSLASGDYHDAVAIFAMILLTAVLGFRQEYRAERGMAALERLSAPRARVRRGGSILTVPARELVYGDIVLLEAGAIVPADTRLIETHTLSADESALTGESHPVEKDSAFLGAGEAIGDRRNMAFLGTIVTSGRGVAVVTATGLQTEMGRISSMLRAEVRQPTPLQAMLDRLGRRLVVAALLGVGFVFAEGLLRGEALRILILTSVSLAVAAVPEGLPAVITILLALGSQRMLKRHALVRRLAAVETLGSVTVICTDKTGTLTENHLKVTHAYIDGQITELSGAVQPDAGTRLLLTCASLSTDVVRGGSETWQGDPTEVALVEAAATAGIEKDVLERQLPRYGERPFDSIRKCMSTEHRIADPTAFAPLILPEPDSAFLSITKGAVGSLLARSSGVWTSEKVEPLSQSAEAAIQNARDSLAGRGMRVIGVAFRPLRETIPAADGLESRLVFLGLLAMTDPPRPEVKAAVAVCREAGIHPLMITGDHALTAQYIAREIGIGNGGPAMTSADLRRLSASGLGSLLDTAVVARASPEDKLVLVEALQRDGQVVAMTGDGVNDAPALAQRGCGRRDGPHRHRLGARVIRRGAAGR